MISGTFNTKGLLWKQRGQKEVAGDKNVDRITNRARFHQNHWSLASTTFTWLATRGIYSNRVAKWFTHRERCSLWPCRLLIPVDPISKSLPAHSTWNMWTGSNPIINARNLVRTAWGWSLSSPCKLLPQLWSRLLWLLQWLELMEGLQNWSTMANHC